MKNKPKVAICIPYYKKTDMLIKLIRSILCQTFGDYVVIITDDSQDECARKYIQALDQRFVYVENEERLGPTANCNCALKIAIEYNPIYLKVMHNDDYFTDRDSLACFVNALEQNPNAVFAFSDTYSMKYANGKVEERSVSEAQLAELHSDFYCLVEKNIIGNPSTLFVRNCGIFMDENLIWLVDVEWYLKLFEYGSQYVHIAEKLVTIGIDGEQVTDYCLQHRELIQREYIYVYLKHYKLQKDAILDAIIRKCVRNYEGKQRIGAYCKEECWAMIKDAAKDGKQICIWAENEQQIITVTKALASIGIRIKYFHMSKMNKVHSEKIADLFYVSVEDMEMDNKDFFCIIAKREAKDIRVMLNKKNIMAIPYVE